MATLGAVSGFLPALDASFIGFIGSEVEGRLSVRGNTVLARVQSKRVACSYSSYLDLHRACPFGIYLLSLRMLHVYMNPILLLLGWYRRLDLVLLKLYIVCCASAGLFWSNSRGWESPYVSLG